MRGRRPPSEEEDHLPSGSSWPSCCTPRALDDSHDTPSSNRSRRSSNKDREPTHPARYAFDDMSSTPATWQDRRECRPCCKESIQCHRSRTYCWHLNRG